MSKAVVITGCDSGIGRATAEFIAKQGSFVFACVLRVSDDAIQWASSINNDNGASICLVELNLLSNDSIKRAVRTIKSEKKSVTALINIAGGTIDSTVLMTRKADLISVFELNLASQIEFTQYMIKIMDRELEKSVVFVSSTAGLSGGVGQLSYAVSKAGVINATKTLSKELGRQGIRVNNVAPGVIDTPMNKSVDVAVVRDRIARTSLGRIGHPIEVASVINFLISSRARHIAGQTIRIDGGLL